MTVNGTAPVAAESVLQARPQQQGLGPTDPLFNQPVSECAGRSDENAGWVSAAARC